MVRVLFLSGVIATKDTVETLASNLIGGYVRHARQAVQEMMEDAQGGILFIDEANKLRRTSWARDHLATKPWDSC